LARWKSLSKLKRLEGLGLKDIFIFGQALAAKTYGSSLPMIVFGGTF
jgi:hypothetical protein